MTPTGPEVRPAPARLADIHPDVLKLGLVSFLTDLSSEMVFSVFAIFFTRVAGASAALLGLIEGLADFSASSLNYLSGWLSDRSGQRKWLVVAGYGKDEKTMHRGASGTLHFCLRTPPSRHGTPSGISSRNSSPTHASPVNTASKHLPGQKLDSATGL